MVKTQFSILVHILTLLVDSEEEWLSSSLISGSLNINPVLVRKEIAALKSKKWIESKEGSKGGIKLIVSPDKILLSDIFLLAKGDNHVLSLSKNQPNPNCPIGKNMNKNLSNLYQEMDDLMAEHLATISLRDFRKQF